MSNKCPACNTTYTKSLSPFDKTWYDCSPCGKTKEELEKEYENRIQKDIIKFEDVVEDTHNYYVPTIPNLMEGLTLIPESLALDPNRIPLEGDYYIDCYGNTKLYKDGKWIAVQFNSNDVSSALDELSENIEDELSTSNFKFKIPESGRYRIDISYITTSEHVKFCIDGKIKDLSLNRAPKDMVISGRIFRVEDINKDSIIEILGPKQDQLKVDIRKEEPFPSEILDYLKYTLD